MRYLIRFILPLCALALLSNCSKKDDPKKPDPTIYISGMVDRRAAIWKDSVWTILPNSSVFGGNSKETATRVVVDGSDVFAIGTSYMSAYPNMLWKNGELIYESQGHEQFYDLADQGGDAYIVGEEKDMGAAAIFKNNVSTALPKDDEPGDAFAQTVFISGTDVYVGGVQQNGSDNTAIFWKDGVKTALGPGAVVCSFVQGNDVYFAGYSQDKLAYWKNGILHTFGDASFGSVFGIGVSGQDIYMVSSGAKSAIWKNDTPFVLDKNSTAYNMTIHNGDVYAVGWYDDGTTQYAQYWKNNIVHNVAHPFGKPSFGMSIFVTD